MDEFCKWFQKPFASFSIDKDGPLYWEFDIWDANHVIESNYQTLTGITATITYFKLITTMVYPPLEVIKYIKSKPYYKLTCEPVTRLFSVGTTITQFEEKITELKNRNVVMVTMKPSPTDNSSAIIDAERFANNTVIDRWAIMNNTIFLSSEYRLTTKERFRNQMVERTYHQKNFVNMGSLNVFYYLIAQTYLKNLMIMDVGVDQNS